MTAAEAVGEGDFSADFLSRYEERWDEHIGRQLDVQAELFRDAVGKVMRGEKPLEEALIEVAVRLVEELRRGAGRVTPQV